MWITLKLSIEKFVEEEYTNYKERTVRVQVYFFFTVERLFKSNLQDC